jgi:hypothetical protein
VQVGNAATGDMTWSGALLGLSPQNQVGLMRLWTRDPLLLQRACVLLNANHDHAPRGMQVQFVYFVASMNRPLTPDRSGPAAPTLEVSWTQQYTVDVWTLEGDVKTNRTVSGSHSSTN